MKVISYCLWGDDPKYTVGALRNAELAEKFFPGWVCRFYIGEHSDDCAEYKELAEKPNVECVPMPDGLEGWKGMFARFLPAGEVDVDVFITRDCDSRFTEREVAAVQEWLDSPQTIHAMRDHPYHTVPILGGLWGAKRGALPDIKLNIDEWAKKDAWQTDQDFLTVIVWPMNYYKLMVHDNWGRFTAPGVTMKRFPMPRQDNDFAGSITGPNEERLHPEHHQDLID